MKVAAVLQEHLNHRKRLLDDILARIDKENERHEQEMDRLNREQCEAQELVDDFRAALAKLDVAEQKP